MREDRVTDTNRSQLLRHPALLASSSLLRLQSDERLANLAVDGHEAAFAAIVDRYRTPLQRYCGGIVGPARAEDAVQQTLISAHEALKRTSEVRHLRSWLYRIAHNTSLNVLRSVRDDVPLDPSHATLADGPDAAFERTERLRETLAAVQALPERQRAALLLRELEGRSHDEIASALGVSSGSARQNLMRARAAVRGAVTAVTPYPLVAKLATGLAASPTAAGWTDAAAGAGAGATIAKLTAGVMATGALVGGAVGTQQVVVHRHHGSRTPTTDASHAAKRAARAARAAAASAAVVPVADPVPAQGGTGSSALSGAAGQHDKSASTGAPRGRDHGQRTLGAGSGGSDGSDDHSSGSSGGQRHDGSSDATARQDESSGSDHGASSDGTRKRDRSGSSDDERSASSGSGKDASGSDTSGSGDGTPAATVTAPSTDGGTQPPPGDESDASTRGDSSRSGRGERPPETVTVAPEPVPAVPGEG